MSFCQIDRVDPAVIVHEIAHLRQRLHRRYSPVDEHLRDEAIEDALLHYWHRPECFEASRGVPLSYYLELRARSYLYVRLRKERRRRRHEKASGVSEKIFENIEKIVSGMRTERCIYIGWDPSEQEQEEREREIQREKAILDAVVAQLSNHDRGRTRLLLKGTSRAEWVRLLRIEDLPRKEQQRKIDSEKDRLRKLLKRRVLKMLGEE